MRIRLRISRMPTAVLSMVSSSVDVSEVVLAKKIIESVDVDARAAMAVWLVRSAAVLVIDVVMVEVVVINAIGSTETRLILSGSPITALAPSAWYVEFNIVALKRSPLSSDATSLADEELGIVKTLLNSPTVPNVTFTSETVVKTAEAKTRAYVELRLARWTSVRSTQSIPPTSMLTYTNAWAPQSCGKQDEHMSGLIAPDLLLHLPGAQSRHAVKPKASPKEPVGQYSQVDAPSMALKRPTAHSVHNVRLAPPKIDKYLPTGHALQESIVDAPVFSLHLPG